MQGGRRLRLSEALEPTQTTSTTSRLASNPGSSIAWYGTHTHTFIQTSSSTPHFTLPTCLARRRLSRCFRPVRALSVVCLCYLQEAVEVDITRVDHVAGLMAHRDVLL